VGLDPKDAAARLGLSNVLRGTIDFSLAVEHLKAAAEMSPGDPDVSANLSFLLLKLARVEEAVAEARRGLAINPGHLELAAAMAHASNYMPGMSGAEIRAAHEVYGTTLEGQFLVRADWKNSREAGKRVKVGLLSYDLRVHPVGFFIEPVMRHRDRERLEMVCYSTCPKEDAHSARLKGLADGWKSVANKSDAEIADVIRGDGVDVLIELSGLTSFHRLGVMAMKPAPVQATFCGYPSTTGLSRIGYRVVDSKTDPAGSERDAVEKLVRIDPSFLCYAGPLETPPRPPRGSKVGAEAEGG
jgi:hypothetical protein